MKIKKQRKGNVHNIMDEDKKIGEATFYNEWNKVKRNYTEYIDILFDKKVISTKKYVINKILSKEIKKTIKNIEYKLK